MVRLSKRLQTIADMVEPCRCVADVGCDHGFVSIYLVQSNRAKQVIAMDVRTGPLDGAREHIREAGLEKQIQVRLSNGLEKLACGEADALVIAGMGGPLMCEILGSELEKTSRFTQMILQPQSELPAFRRFLRENGFEILQEEIVFEDGKYYFPMRVGKATVRMEQDVRRQELEDRFGACLLQKKDQVFLSYLERELHTLEEVKESLSQLDTERSKARRKEIQEEIDWVKAAISF